MDSQLLLCPESWGKTSLTGRNEGKELPNHDENPYAGVFGETWGALSECLPNIEVRSYFGDGNWTIFELIMKVMPFQ
jgi:hypothetical protein